MPGRIIYLEIDDEITSAAARIRASEARIAVVLPYASRVATSRINFRLLSRDALTHEKRLSIVSGDPATRALAASAGLPVFASVAELHWVRKGAVTAEPTRDVPVIPRRPPARCGTRARAGAQASDGTLGLVVAAAAVAAGAGAAPEGRPRETPRRHAGPPSRRASRGGRATAARWPGPAPACGRIPRSQRRRPDPQGSGGMRRRGSAVARQSWPSPCWSAGSGPTCCCHRRPSW